MKKNLITERTKGDIDMRVQAALNTRVKNYPTNSRDDDPNEFKTQNEYGNAEPLNGFTAEQENEFLRYPYENPNRLPVELARPQWTDRGYTADQENARQKSPGLKITPPGKDGDEDDDLGKPYTNQLAFNNPMQMQDPDTAMPMKYVVPEGKGAVLNQLVEMLLDENDKPTRFEYRDGSIVEVTVEDAMKICEKYLDLPEDLQEQYRVILDKNAVAFMQIYKQ